MTAATDVLVEAALAVERAVRGLTADDRRAIAAGRPDDAGRRGDQYVVDLAADEAACAVLTRNGLGVLSEESGWRHRDRRRLVVLDPVDGSANCARGRGPHGPSLCLVDRDGPLAAVVYDLESGVCYTAERGRGAQLDGRPIAGPIRARLTELAVGDEGFRLAGLRSTFSGASAHDLCRVATGTADAYVDIVNTEACWDYLAAALIVTERGGTVQERSGAELWDPGAPARAARIAAAGSARLWNELSALLAGDPPGAP